MALVNSPNTSLRLGNEVDSSTLSQIDSALDQAIPSHLISCIPRDVAIIHLLRFYEHYNRFELPARLQFQKDGFIEGAKLGQDAVHFAMQWVYKFAAPPRGPRKTIKTNPKIYTTMKQLWQAAGEYSHAWDYMSMWHRRWVNVDVAPNNQIILSYIDKYAEEGDVADLLLNSSDAPDEIAMATIQTSKTNPAEIIKEAQIRLLKDGLVDYKFPDQSFNRMKKHLETAMDHLWQFPQEWDLGGYTLGEFKKLWFALLVRCQIHSLLCFKSDNESLGLESAVLVRTRTAWANELSRLSGINYHSVQLILDDLIYDPMLYKQGSKQPDVTHQPLFCLGDDMIAPSNWLVIFSNAERNLWDLLNIKRPNLHSLLRNQKENQWVHEWKTKAPKLGLIAKGPIKFNSDGVEGDIDLVLIDKDRQFIMLCQLKWVQAPDRIKEIYYATKELDQGIQQAKKSHLWVAQNSASFAQKLELPLSEFAKFEVQSCVLSKYSMGKGHIIEPNVPVISERLAEWVLGNPLFKPLKALWTIANERRYQPKTGIHYVESDSSAGFGDYKFIFQNGGIQSKRAWSPETDIDVSGL